MDHEAAAYLLNFVCGLALIYPLYRLARNAFGAAAGVITAWFLALLPPLAEYSSEVVREPLFWCLAAWSLLLFMRAVQPREPRGWSLWRLALSGALALAAMLVRLEALALLGGYGAALLLGHATRGTAWQGGRRILAVIALMIAVPLAGAPAFGYLWQRTGKAQWARLDQIFGQYSLGAIRTGAADPLAVSKDVMYTAGGKVDNAAMVRSLFMRLAARHRHIVFAAEMAGAFWKASYGIGIALIACGAWYALRSRRLASSSPFAIVSAGVCVIMLAVIARYAATHYYVGTRHALFVVLVLSVFAGAWAGAWPSCDRLCRIVATGTLVVAAVVMLCQDAKPIRRDKLAVRECGIALRAALPPGAVVAGSDAVKTAVYYARRPFRLRPVHAPDRIAAFITAEPRRYLLLNTNDPAQAACATALSGTLRRVEIPLPETKRYAFILLTGAGD